MMDTLTVEAHSAIFQGKTTYLKTCELILAFNNFLANITVWLDPVCLTSRLRQMSRRCVLIFLNYFMSFLIILHQIVKLARMCLNGNISCWKLISYQTCCTLKYGPISLQIKPYLLFSAANQTKQLKREGMYGLIWSSQMTTMSQISYSARLAPRAQKMWASPLECDVRGKWPPCECSLWQTIKTQLIPWQFHQ